MEHLKNKMIFAAAFLMAIFGGLIFAATAEPNTPHKMLVIHSYHADYTWVDNITKGIKDGIRGENVELKIFYMDTKRKTDQKWKTEIGKKARQEIDTWKPDVVITCDDNAQMFVGQRYTGKAKPMFVFCGVNAEPEKYGYPASNVTGILERPHFVESFNYLKKIVPDIKNVAVISDNSPTSMGFINSIQKKSIDAKILGYHIIGQFDLWKKRITEYNKKIDALFIYTYHTIKDKGSKASIPSKTILDWTWQNCEIPTIGLNDFAIKDGILCGIVESGYEHGYEAAKMAVELLNGKSIHDVPMRTAKKGLKMINLKTAAKLGITVPQEIIDNADEVIKSE